MFRRKQSPPLLKKVRFRLTLPSLYLFTTRLTQAPNPPASKTLPNPTILPGSNYLSFTVADLKKSFGEVSSTESNEGEGSILSFKNCNYKFIVNSASPADSDRVNSVIVLKGGEIVPGAKVGQSYNQIYNSFDSAFQFSFDEEEEIAVATTSSSNANYFIYFEKEDKNTPSLSALIKLK